MQVQAAKEKQAQAEVAARCYRAALRLLTVRARSRAELEKRLSDKGYAASIVEATLAELQQRRLIDDAQFARNWVESRLQYRPCGAAKLRWELRRKGIAEQLATAVIEQALESTGELELASELAEGRWHRLRSAKRQPGAEFDVNKECSKLGRFLSGRGFSYSVIRQVINKLKGAETEDEP